MSETTTNSMQEKGWYVCLIGWAICAASVFFFLGNKSAEQPLVIPFWICVAVLAGVSLFYLVARRVSEHWRPKVIRSYFSPYLVGATFWLLLILLHAALASFAK